MTSEAVTSADLATLPLRDDAHMKALSFSEGHVHDGSALDCFACMAPVDAPIAHDTARCGPNKDVPVVIEDPAIYPWPEGERDRDWHPATGEELNAHYAYWTVAA